METKFKLLYNEEYFNDNEGLNLNIDKIREEIHQSEYISKLENDRDFLLQQNKKLEYEISKLQEQYNDLYSIITLLDITKIEYVRNDYDVNVYYSGNIFELKSYDPYNVISTPLGEVQLYMYEPNEISYIDYQKINDLNIKY